jgi:glutamate/tyrosine decarboxylase-like PLP-dependent enzyme
MEEDVSRQMMELVDPGFEEADSGDLHMTRCLHELVRDHPDFEVLCEAALDPYHFRYVPHPLAERQDDLEIQKLLDRINEEIVESLQRIGLDSVITTRVQGRIAIQILNARSATDIHATFEATARWGRLVNTKRSELSKETESDAGINHEASCSTSSTERALQTHNNC